MEDNQIKNNSNESQKASANYDVVIIGGGPAGSTAAIYAARSGLKTLVVDKGLTSGALGITSKIVNYPGIVEEISAAQLVEKMREQAKLFGAEYISDKVIGVDLQSETKSIFGNGGVYNSRFVIISTGSMGRGVRIQGEDRLLGHGVSYCATCDAAFYRNKDVVVAGNTDEAIEEALFLTKFANQVYFLSQTERLAAPQELVETLKNHPKVILYAGTKLKEIIGENRVEAVLAVQSDQHEVLLSVSGAFVYLQGGRPVTDFIQGQLEVSQSGCLIVDSSFQTSIPGVYAIGDVLCTHVKQVVVSAAEGAIAAMAIEKEINGRSRMMVDWSEKKQ